MAVSEGFSASQKLRIDRAIRDAETASRLEFSVFVGSTENQGRAFAQRLHASLAAPAKSVLIVVDPTSRVIEIVTGSSARSALTDDEVGSTIAAMGSDVAAGELVDGIIGAVQRLAHQAVDARS